MSSFVTNAPETPLIAKAAAQRHILPFEHRLHAPNIPAQSQRQTSSGLPSRPCVSCENAPPRPPPTHAAVCGGGYGMKGEQKKVGFVLSVYAPGFTSRGGNVPEGSHLAFAVHLVNDL